MNYKLKKRCIWFLFVVMKIVYMVLAIAIISKVTTLGDTFDYFYLNKPQNTPMPYLLANSTFWMNLFGHNLYLLFGKYIANIPFIFLSVYGVYYPIKKMKLTTKQLLFVLVVLSFPSFGIWTSICSKESVGVFFMGILLGYIIDIYEQKRKYPNLLELLAFYLLLIFKTQYAPAIFVVILYIKISQKFKLKRIGKLFLAVSFILLGLVTAFLIRDYMQYIAEILPQHFSMLSNSTRENTIWIEKYDIYYNALEGMLIAFIGPTFTEAMSNKIKLFVFLESMLIITIYLIIIIKIFVRRKINIYFVSLFFFTFFLILFGHYPFGVFNPGSAIRYRENFYAFLFLFLLYIYRQQKKYTRKVNYEKNSGNCN